MRSDMSKVLVERPRRGGCGKELIRANRHETNIACKMAVHDTDIETDNYHSVKRVHQSSGYGNTKELNENLKPLRRFLRSRVGQPWNKVYSEIMAGLNLSSSVQYHVWQHLVQFGEVETKTYMEGNTVMLAGSSPRSVGSYSWREEFYVHPKTGLLCVSGKDNKYRRNKEENSDNRYIDKKHPLTQYHKVDGIWYEYKFREASAEEKKQKSFGEPRQTFVSLTSYETVWKWTKISGNKFIEQMKDNYRPIYHYYAHDGLWTTCKELFGGAYLPISKRQISSREVKKIEGLMSLRRPHKKAA